MGNNYSELSGLDDNDVMLVQTGRDLQLNGRNGQFSPRRRRPAVHLDTINWLTSVRPEMVISCSSDKSIALNNIDTGACLMRWRGHEREVSKVVYKRVGCTHFLLSGSKDATIRLWHFNSAECRKVFTGHHELGVTGLAVLDEVKFVSGGKDGRVALWDVEMPGPVRSVGSSQNVVTHIDRDPDAKTLYQTAEDGTLRLWDAQNLSPICQLPSSSSLWHCSTTTADPNVCLTAGGGSLGDGCVVELWDLRQRKCLQQFRGHEGSVRCAIFLHQQQVTWKRLILSVSVDKTVRLWDANTARCVWSENTPAELSCCVGSSDGSVVVAGGCATLCDLRLAVKAGRPYLFCNSIQSNNDH
uniref:WD_REPEATS_REGION domain-containing protein n=1 Tax=Globodera pallida TaxID=36090 RepID=A0A183CDE7_GLOPA